MVDNLPDSNFSGLLQHYREAGCRGIGKYTPDSPFDGPLNMNVFKHVEEARLPLTFHVALRVEGFHGCVDDLELPRLERVLKACPDLVLLGHSLDLLSSMSPRSTCRSAVVSNLSSFAQRAGRDRIGERLIWYTLSDDSGIARKGNPRAPLRS